MEDLIYYVYNLQRTWIFILFHEHQWARRLLGGKWEGWLVDRGGGHLEWFNVEEFTDEKTPITPNYIKNLEKKFYHGEMTAEDFYNSISNRPHAACRGTPTKEDWGPV